MHQFCKKRRKKKKHHSQLHRGQKRHYDIPNLTFKGMGATQLSPPNRQFIYSQPGCAIKCRRQLAEIIRLVIRRNQSATNQSKKNGPTAHHILNPSKTTHLQKKTKTIVHQPTFNHRYSKLYYRVFLMTFRHRGPACSVSALNIVHKSIFSLIFMLRRFRSTFLVSQT